LLLPSARIAAVQDEPHDTTLEAATRFVERHDTASPARIQVKVGTIDPRMKQLMWIDRCQHNCVNSGIWRHATAVP